MVCSALSGSCGCSDEPSQRKGPLAPYAREAETKTLDLLEDALLPGGTSRVDPVILDKLLRDAARDVEELLPHLEARGRDVAEGARMLLEKRAATILQPVPK